MDKEAQRIAIADACGWKRSEEARGPTLADRKHWIKPGDDGSDYHTQCHLPDYLNDLNAMHEAEMKFADQYDGNFIFNFRCELHTLLGHDGTMAVHATAAQRAEAFLRAIGKWQDSRPRPH